MPGIWKAGRFPLSAKPDPCGAVGLPIGTTKLAGRGKAGMLWNGAFGGGSFLSTPALLEDPAAAAIGGTLIGDPPMSGPTLACVSFLSASE